MKIKPNNPPRKFEVGYEYKRVLKDCARIELDDDEQVTFTTTDGCEYDVCKKDWGFYATPSINKRLINFKLKTVLAKNRDNNLFILLVQTGKEDAFEQYLKEEQMTVVSWLYKTEDSK